VLRAREFPFQLLNLKLQPKQFSKVEREQENFDGTVVCN